MLKTLSLKIALGLGVPYGFACASLYLFAYWQPVGLNPFHYANAADLVSATLGGIVLSLALMCAGMFLGLATSPHFYQSSNTSDSDAPSVSRLQKANAIFSLFALVVLLGLTWWKDDPYKWMAVGALVTALTPLVLRNSTWASTKFPSFGEQLTFAVLIFGLPFTFYSQGAVAISKSLRPSTGMAVDVARSDVGTAVVDRVMYVGMLGDFHVLRELASATTLLVPGGNRIAVREASAQNSEVKSDAGMKAVRPASGQIIPLADPIK